MQPLQEVLGLLPDPVAEPLLGEQVEVLQLVLVGHRPLGTAGLEIHVADEVAVGAELLVAEGELEVGDGVLLDELDLGVVELRRVVGEVLRGS